MQSGRGDRNLVLIVVDGLVLGRWAIATGGMKPPMIEPVDVLQGGQLELVEVTPGPVSFYQLGLVQAVYRLGERVVVRISFTPTETDAPASARRSV